MRHPLPTFCTSHINNNSSTVCTCLLGSGTRYHPTGRGTVLQSCNNKRRILTCAVKDKTNTCYKAIPQQEKPMVFWILKLVINVSNQALVLWRTRFKCFSVLVLLHPCIVFLDKKICFFKYCLLAPWGIKGKPIRRVGVLKAVSCYKNHSKHQPFKLVCYNLGT